MSPFLLATDIMSLALVSGAIGCSFAAAYFVSSIQRYDAPERARLLLRYALAPWCLAWAAVLLPFFPTFLSAEVGLTDWCLERNAYNLLACPMHGGPAIADARTYFMSGMLALLCLLLTWRLLHAFWQVLTLARKARLIRIAQFEHAGCQIDVLPSERVMALSMSLPSPHVVLTLPLLAQMPAHELRALLEHEKAHLKRRDGFARLIVELATSLMLPRAAQRIRAAWNLAAEISCDAAAARATDACTVASALLSYTRLSQKLPADVGALVSAFDHGDVKARILALTEPQAHPAVPRLSLRWMLVAALPLAFVLHELGEFVLLPLAR